MSNKTNLKALYDGSLEIGENYSIDSAVLNNEERTRVLSQKEVVKALGRSQGGSKRGEANLPRWISASNLTPYISSELREAILNPIVYKTTNGNTAHGIEATMLVDICEVWLDLEKSGDIHESQKETARRAYILFKSLAKTSIIALVDEATGYQSAKDRAKDTLQIFLKRALQEEAVKWVKTFQDEFFEMIFMMKGWTWGNTSKKPGVVGHYINDLVYARISPDLVDELRRLNPKVKGRRKAKHHQHLTKDFGHPILKDHLAGLIALGRASGYDWDIFMQMVNKAYPIYGKTIQMNFPETLEDLDNSKNDTDLSNFNKSLKTALDHKPPKEES
ncbi:MAG: P63C domain-containing protein [Fluviicola sp.]